jgi:N-acetylmuramoyl-L-alanine amidase
MNQDTYLEQESTETIEPCEDINEINNDPEEVRRGQDEATRSFGTKVQQAPGCSTAVLSGLSKQIIDEMNNIEPDCLVSFADLNVQNGAAVNPFLQPKAKAALARAIADRGQTLVVNSAYRTLPQQLMLYNQYKSGRCGIAIAASPSTSNHEDGLALDVQDPRGWEPYFIKHGWRPLRGDPPHFDYKGGGRSDISNIAVKAFQRLWNRYNSSDRIAEDGDCGATTLARLNKSPIAGFGETNTTRILRLNQPFMEGDDVRKIQQTLVKANISVTVDGIFGTDTENAIKQFQQQKGLTPDGIVGTATRLELGL